MKKRVFAIVYHRQHSSLCYLSLVFAMVLRLFSAALWSPEVKGPTSWFLFVMFIVILLLSNLVSLDRCGA